MNKKHGILICADTHTVCDVHAAIWNGMEIRKKLVLLHQEEIVHGDLRNDTIVIQAASNVDAAGEGPKASFELFGKRYYGNALIISDEGRDSPRITPEEVAHVIRFLEPNEGERFGQGLALSAA